MEEKGNIAEYVQSFLASPRMKGQTVFHRLIPETPSSFQEVKKPLHEDVKNMLGHMGIRNLYSHQAEAIDMIGEGKHVVVATPTASGKTLIYNLPVFEKILSRPDTAALYIFPLKALAQDQLKTFEEMAACFKNKPTAAIYDGDTTAWQRKKIRDNPPNVIMTNPEMMHLSFLPYHDRWAEFIKKLEVVVIDEVHTYRGILGSHMAQVFRRFQRICERYGASPTYVFSSATVANPAELAGDLTGLDVTSVMESGAPRGRRNIIFLDPVTSPSQAAILLLKSALPRSLRTIVYCQSRKMTELIAIWAGSKSGEYADHISAYRAGFLPEERREIEGKLASGELLAVISTSALELGIDIGDLDLCVLVGYPGSIMGTWQRGGRVGREGQDSALFLVAGEDALDQYFMRNPDDFFKRQPEAAVINPHNPAILEKHLVCAAAEIPLSLDEPLLSDDRVRQSVFALETKGELLRGMDGDLFYSKWKFPQRHVDLRGSGSRFEIVDKNTGESRGDIDGFRAFRDTHPGAVYLHHGATYLVDDLDLGTMTVSVSEARVNYYTRARSHKETEILEVLAEKPAWGGSVFLGRLKVTDQVTGYEKWRLHARQRIGMYPLDLPPQIFETEGIWFKIPNAIQEKTDKNFKHFMGGIHAVEHAAIGIFPLYVLTDRNDLGGISITYHPQVDSAAVFIYDGIPGGAGLSRQAFSEAEKLLESTLKIITACPCETGCPSCVHSPKCGSGNRPIDKSAAIFILEEMKAAKRGIKRKPAEIIVKEEPVAMPVKSKTGPAYYGVFDIETQLSAQEVGGWHRADLMRVSCIVLYDSKQDAYLEFLEKDVAAFIEHVKNMDLVIGFNNRRFDNRVLAGYSNFDMGSLPTLDILEDIHKQLGYRLSLDHVAKVTLGKEKTASGLQALKWWKMGMIREILDYCRMDVEITRNLYLYGRENGYLLFMNKAKQTVRLPVKW